MWQGNAAGRRDVDSALIRWGLPPCVDSTVANGLPGSGECRRALEIATWVKAHPHAVQHGWVALDDLDLSVAGPPPAFSPLLPPGHFVQCNGAVGLTAVNAMRAVQLLGGPNADAPQLPPPRPESAQPILRSVLMAAAVGMEGHKVYRSDARYGNLDDVFALGGRMAVAK